MFALFIAAALTCSPARAQTCGAIPNTLTNGMLADEAQRLREASQTPTSSFVPQSIDQSTNFLFQPK